MLSHIENASHRLFLFFIFTFLSIFAIYFIFSGTLSIPFYHHDIYKFSNGGIHISCRPNDAGYGFLYDIARPFSAWLDCVNFKFANTLTAMKYFRIICSILIGIVMGAFAFWLNLENFCLICAFCISGAIFCLPALQTTMIMLATNISLSIFLAFLANILVNKCSLSAIFTQKKQISRYEKWIAFFYFFSGVGCLLISFFTYPSMSGFYFLPTLVIVLFKPWKEWLTIRGIFIKDVFIFGIVSLLFFLIARHIQHTHMGAEISNLISAYRYQLNFNIAERIVTLIKLIASLWSTNVLLWPYSLFIYFIIIAGLLVGGLKFFNSDFFKRTKYKASYYLVQRMIAVCVLIIMGSAFYIAQPENVLLGRILFIYQAMIIVILAWCLFQLANLFTFKTNAAWTIMLGGLFFSAAVYTNYVTTKSALNDNMELNYITQSIAGYINSGMKLERIHIISASVDNFNGLPKPDDILNGNSTQYAGDMTNIVNAALLQLAQKHSFHLTNCLFSESEEEHHFADEKKCMFSAPKNNIIVTYSRPGKLFYKTPHMLLIDMNVLAPFAGASKIDLKQ